MDTAVIEGRVIAHAPFGQFFTAYRIVVACGHEYDVETTLRFTLGDTLRVTALADGTVLHVERRPHAGHDVGEEQRDQEVVHASNVSPAHASRQSEGGADVVPMRRASR